MSGGRQGDDWWLGSDGKWYPPEARLSDPPEPPPPSTVDALATSQPGDRVRRPGLVFTWMVLVVVAAVWLPGGRPGSSDDVGTDPVDPATRCESAPRMLLDAIESRLRFDRHSLRDGFIVRSDDWPAIRFVAAEIDGSGLEQWGRVGVWATDDASLAAGFIMAVDYPAQVFSGWPNAYDAQGLSMSDDGARQAEICEELR